MTKLGDIFAKGVAALEAEQLEGIREASAAMAKEGAKDDLRRRYLDFMAVWLDMEAGDDDFEAALADAESLLEQAIELDDPADAARIVLDVADIPLNLGELEEPEHALRQLSARSDLDTKPRSEARLLRAQLALDHFEDPEEALALLDAVDDSFHTDLGYISLRAAVLADLERGEQAIELLEASLAADDDVELRYQLGIMLREHGREDAAREQLLTVRRRDLVAYEVDESAPVDAGEARDLERYLEDVLDSLPNPVLERVGSTAIRVERWASEGAVTGGCDPRNSLRFEGQPDSDEADDGHVDAIVIHRDAVVALIDDDAEIIDALTLGLVEEFDRFFGLELIPGV